MTTSSEGQRIPTRLKRDPIVFAVSELRFRPSTNTRARPSEVLPGLILSQLPGQYPNFRPQPMIPLPQQLRDAIPQFKYMGQVRLEGESGAVAIGDSVISISCDPPYPGWQGWKPRILDVWRIVQLSDFVAEVEAITLRYTNVIESPMGSDQISLTNCDVRLGFKHIRTEPLTLRTELRDPKGMVAILQLVSQASAAAAKSVGGPEIHRRDGLVIDVDVVSVGPFPEFWGAAPNLLDEAHEFEKKTFFGLLADATLKAYGPEY
jgi:uncharacterized protein (TIGR04255 family)